MSHHYSINNPILNLIPKDIDKCIILDFGFGYGYWGYTIKIRKDGDPKIIGLEIFPPYVKKVYKTKIYTHIVIGDIRYYPFKKEIADIVIATEVLEHIERESGLRLIDKLFDLSRNLTIISTPLGFMKTKGYDDNKHQIHQSAYKAEDFTKKGYYVKIIRIQPLPRIVRIFNQIYRKLRGRNTIRKQIVAHKVRRHYHTKEQLIPVVNQSVSHVDANHPCEIEAVW